jgi:hypothetical protein
VLDSLTHLFMSGGSHFLDISLGLFTTLEDQGFGALADRGAAAGKLILGILNPTGLLLSAVTLTGLHTGGGLAYGSLTDGIRLSLGGQYPGNGFFGQEFHLLSFAKRLEKSLSISFFVEKHRPRDNPSQGRLFQLNHLYILPHFPIYFNSFS